MEGCHLTDEEGAAVRNCLAEKQSDGGETLVEEGSASDGPKETRVY